jgi:hypothetical protein
MSPLLATRYIGIGTVASPKWRLGLCRPQPATDETPEADAALDRRHGLSSRAHQGSDGDAALLGLFGDLVAL